MTGAELRAKREAAGMTQADLAARIGCAFETVCRWESGKLGFRRTSIIALESVLGTVPSKPKRSRSRKS